MPKVSICTPVLNMKDWLRECIASVVAQTYQDWEMVIVDDGSTDNIGAVVASFNDARLRLIKLPANVGVTRAGNTAFRAALGEYINPLAADEWIQPYKLADQVAFMEANPDVGAVFGLPGTIADGPVMPEPVKDAYELRAYNRSRVEWLQTLLSVRDVPICSASALWRRRVFEVAGYFDENLKITCDLEWYIRLVKSFAIHIEPRVMAGCRARPDGGAISSVTTKNTLAMASEMELVHKKHGANNTAKIAYSGKVVIATPFRSGEGYAQYTQSLVGLVTVLEKMGVRWDYWPIDGFSYVDQARNIVCAKLLESDATDLFFIDSDEEFDTMGFLRVLLAPVDVVGAAYPVKNDWERWTAQWKVRDGHPTGKLLPDGGALLETDGLPAGFLRIRRTALERFRDAYPDLQYVDPTADPSAPDRVYTAFFERAREAGQTWGEDYMFSRRWKKIGGELWIEPRVSITHYGIKGWFGNLDGYLRSLPMPQPEMTQ